MTVTLADARAWERLRAPFPDEAVGLKPVYAGGYEPDGATGEMRIPPAAFGRCEVCGRWHDRPARHLRYVGHARITERLCDVDPEWSWEPLALDDSGLPLIRGGCLWIRLHVLGAERIGVGSADGRGGPDAVKEMIGDAIRNAAMRFGCGLEMWYGDDAEEAPPEMPEAPAGAGVAAPGEPFDGSVGPKATKYQRRLSEALCALEAGTGGGADAARALCEEFGRPWRQLNRQECEAALEMVAAMGGADAPDGDEEVIPV